MNSGISSNSAILLTPKVTAREGKTKTKQNTGWIWRDNWKLDSCLRLSNCLKGRNRKSGYNEIIRICTYLGWVFKFMMSLDVFRHGIWDRLFSNLLNILMAYWNELCKITVPYKLGSVREHPHRLKKCWDGKFHKEVTFTLPPAGYCCKWQRYKYNFNVLPSSNWKQEYWSN